LVWYTELYYIGMVYKIVLYWYGIQNCTILVWYSTLYYNGMGLSAALYQGDIQHCIIMVWDLALHCIRVIFSIVL
jgi:hypothetical protein